MRLPFRLPGQRSRRPIVGGGSGTTGSTATGLSATGSGSGVNNGTDMNGNRTGMKSTRMNNTGNGINNGSGTTGSSRINGMGTSQE